MIFTATPLPGAFLIEPEPQSDERGFFARLFDEDAFAQRRLPTRYPQCSVSWNERAGTLRGMHYQAAPHGECKLVRVTSGAAFDVMVDLRRDSPTFRQWYGVELSAANRRTVYIPDGLAHGFQTLADGTELYYQISARYEPSAARGVRWNDPAFGIRWPEQPVRIISERDRHLPDFQP